MGLQFLKKRLKLLPSLQIMKMSSNWRAKHLR